MKYTLIICVSLLFITGCDQNSDDKHGHAEEDEHDHMHSEHEGEEVLHITSNQFNSLGLALGEMDSIYTGNFIKANGVLDVPPAEIAKVTTPIGAFVKSIVPEFLPGSQIRKGQKLATLSHPDIVKLQQNYVELLSELSFKKEELERQEELTAADAGRKKDLQLAKSEYDILLARKKGMQSELSFLGLSVEEISAGNFQDAIHLTAPISGYITKIQIQTGTYVHPNEELYEIINTDHIHLELNVFEKDLSKVKVDQYITFTVPSQGEKEYEGKVRLINRTFNAENKAIRVHGHIEGEHPEFIRGSYVEARIWLSKKHVLAIPATAVVKAEGIQYIFYLDGRDEEHLNFKRARIKTGLKSGEKVEVIPIDEIPEKVQIVTREAFYLLSEMRKEEFEHSH